MLGRTKSVERGSDRLGERRRNRRRRTVIAFCILVLILLGTCIWGLQQNSVRISRVEISGADTSFSTYATTAMQGSYLGIIPRDSIFFFPEDRIRADILAAHQDIAAVSITRSSLTSLSIKIDKRTPIARWCGLAPTLGVEEYCYIFDANGFIFAPASTTTEPLNSFSLYALLTNNMLEPLRATLSRADQLPAVFDFARQLSTLGASTTQIVIRDNSEVDDYLANGTRVTYVLGNEQNAFTALVSARDNFSLADGSVDYIDLRFDGKVYLKRRE